MNALNHEMNQEQALPDRPKRRRPVVVIALIVVSLTVLTLVLFAGTKLLDLAMEPSLLKAAANGDLELVKRWCRWRSPNVPEGSMSPLHAAVSTDQREVVDYLIARGADVNAVTAFGDSVLWHAAELRNRPLYDLLRKHGAHCTLQDAVWVGDAESIRELADEDLSFSQDSRKWNLNWMLNQAVDQGNADVVEALLERGADPNPPWEDPGPLPPGAMAYRPLPSSVRKGHLAKVRVLLEHGAQFDPTEPDAKSALENAVYMNHKEILQLLEEYGFIDLPVEQIAPRIGDDPVVFHPRLKRSGTPTGSP